MSGGRRRRDSGFRSGLSIVAAAVVLVAAVWVVMSVFGRIRSDYEELELTENREESSETSLDIEIVEEPGWNEKDHGWKYLLEDETYAKDQWLEVDGFLYHFDEEEWMQTGEWESEGQIYTFHDTKGYLKDIQVDLDYVPDDMGENLDSLARTNAFWCYLDDESEGLFKKILYRKTVDNKVMGLGDESSPEKTTRYSMRADGDYVYWLPKVKESQLNQLSEKEKALCNTLFRMIPGQKTKEMVAEDVGGYVILDGVIYYSQNGKIYGAESGTQMPAGKTGYLVEMRDDALYLVDVLGNPAEAEDGNYISIEDRMYRIEDDGRIRYVKKAPVTYGGRIYTLEGTGIKSAVYADGQAVIRSDYGIQSFCVAGQTIYYSAYVKQGSDGEWYSRIFKTDLSGSGQTQSGPAFPGVVQNMYYFEEEGQIYGEYHPAIWRQAYGVIAAIGTDGSLYKLEDSSARTGKTVSGNDMLELIMANSGDIYCLWHDCQWSKSAGISAVLWSKAVKLDAGSRTAVQTVDLDMLQEEEETTKAQEETEDEVVVQPIKPTVPETSAAAGQTPGSTAAGNPEISVKPPSGSSSPDVEMEAPGAESSTPVPTVPPVPEEIEIIPLG